MLILYAVFFFNLIISVSTQLNHCSNSLNQVIFKSIIDQRMTYYLGKARLLDEDKGTSIKEILMIILNHPNKKSAILDLKPELMPKLEDFFGEEEHLKNVTILIDNFIEDNNTYFNDFINSLDKNAQEILRKLDEMYDKYDNIRAILIFITTEDIARSLANFGKNSPELANLIYLLPKYYNFSIIDNDELETIFEEIKKFLVKNIDIISIAPYAIEAFNNKDDNNDKYEKIFKIIGNYVYNRTSIILDILELFKNNRNITLLLNEILIDKEEPKKTQKINIILNYIFEHHEDVNKIYEILANDTDILKEIPELILHLNSVKYLISTLFSNNALISHPDLISILISAGLSFIGQGSKANDFIDVLVSLAQGAVLAFKYNKEDEIRSKFSQECIDLVNFAFLGNYSLEDNNNTEFSKNMSTFFVYKTIIDTTKSSNDLLTYDNCLKKPPILPDLDIDKPEEFGFVPSFVVATMDNSVGENKKIFKNSTQLEDLYYVASVCLPQGIKSGKNSKKYLHCTDKEYELILGYAFNFLSDTSKTEIKVISIKKTQNVTDNISKLAIGLGKLIPFYIILIPFILFIILFIFQNSNINQKKDQNKNERLLQDNPENKEKYEQILFIKNNPKWIIYLNEFLNFSNNGKELFDFEQTNTKCNDIKGLLYIGGLTGISIVLTILGQIYLILYNLPMKDFGTSNFYNLINSYFYIFFFIGLRYSPRILFSCSGYTLSYKYLDFVINEQNYFIKFIFRHFYKYLMLLLLLLFWRHSYYYIVTILFDIQPINELFNQNVLMVPEEPLSFTSSLFGIKSFQYQKIDSRVRHYLADYFWMPFNEIFFFIFGTFLISIGYKFKLRIDFAIIILVIILFLGKIIAYYIINSKDEIYTTLYYYMFDYGEIMINPIFNLSYFLIGMFFGLMNYIKERGVFLKKDDFYQKLRINNEIENNKDEEDLIKINDISRKSMGRNESSQFQIDNYDEDFSDDNSSEKGRKSLGLKRPTLSFNKKKDENLIPKNNENINDKNISQDIQKTPFLKLPVLIRDWHGRTEMKLFYIILLVLSLIILFFLFSTKIFLFADKKSIDNNKAYNNMNKKLIRLSLENIITDKILNCIYLIDIELVVFFVHWGLFILLIKQQFIIEFFNHIYWTFFNKFYFSFILACNSTILFIFYESETVVKLNEFNLWLFFFICTAFIFINTLIFYIAFELPLKRLFKFWFSNNYSIDLGKEEFIKSNNTNNKKEVTVDDNSSSNSGK